MAARANWKGHLRLSLVSCAVGLYPAVSSSRELKCHTINRETGNRIQSRYVDAKSGKPVEDADQVKGYQRGDDDYVVLEDEELEAVALESARTEALGLLKDESIDVLRSLKSHPLVDAGAHPLGMLMALVIVR